MHLCTAYGHIESCQGWNHSSRRLFSWLHPATRPPSSLLDCCQQQLLCSCISALCRQHPQALQHCVVCLAGTHATASKTHNEDHVLACCCIHEQPNVARLADPEGGSSCKKYLSMMERVASSSVSSVLHSSHSIPPRPPSSPTPAVCLAKRLKPQTKVTFFRRKRFSPARGRGGHPSQPQEAQSRGQECCYLQPRPSGSSLAELPSQNAAA